MKIEQKALIVESIEKLQARKGLSQNKFANDVLGISPAQLSNVMNLKNWHKVGDEMWRKLWNITGLGSTWQINTQSANYKLVNAVCNDARINARMLAIYGNSGFGKTTALKEASKQSETFYVFCNALMSKRKFVEEIAAKMGVMRKGDLVDIINRISSKLKRLKKPLLIFDDAGKLKWLNHQTIQLLFDLNEGNVGIVIAGTPYLKSFIDKGFAKGKNGFDEYQRRISFWQVLTAPRPETVVELCKAQGIFDAHCIRFINRKASDFGTLKSIISNAKMAAKNRGVETVDLTLLESLNIAN